MQCNAELSKACTYIVMTNIYLSTDQPIFNNQIKTIFQEHFVQLKMASFEDEENYCSMFLKRETIVNLL